MSRIGTASPGMRLVMMLFMYILSLLALSAGFVLGVMLASGPWHEGDLAALMEERGIADLFAERRGDPALFEQGAERLLSKSPVLGVYIVAGDSLLYQGRTGKGETLPLEELRSFRHKGRIVRYGERLLYSWSPPQWNEIQVVLQLSTAPRPWRAAVSSALARLGNLPTRFLLLGMAGWALVCTLAAWGIGWFFHSRQLSRFLSLLEVVENLEELDGQAFFGYELGGQLAGCVGRLVQHTEQIEKHRFEALLPRRKGYDFAGFDAATVYAGEAESPALYADIRPLSAGRYGVMLLAVHGGAESSETLIKIATAADTCFSLYENPAQIAAALNRYLYSMSVTFPLHAGFLIATPAERLLEFCLLGSVTLLRHDLREGVMRGYDLKQPVLTGVAPEVVDAEIGFARLEVGAGDPLVLTFGPEIDWQELVSAVLRKSTTLAERQQTLVSLLAQRLEAGKNAAALLMSLA